MTIKELCVEAHRIATLKGWHDPAKHATFAEQLALMHAELSEALEWWRRADVQNDPRIAEEFADLFIRAADTCAHYDIDLEAAILQKMKKNARRAYRHGGKRI